MKNTVAFSKKSTNVFFHILTKCNLCCRHCYINEEQHGDNTLPIDVINSWLPLFKKADTNTNLIFLGGEPTLHPDLSLAIKKANDLGFSSVTVDTNGYLFNDILSKVEPDEVGYFSFSLDGPDSIRNDAIRGKGSFDNCIKGIRQAWKRGFSISLIFTVSVENINELADMLPLLKDLHIDRFFIQIIGMRGKSVTDSEIMQVTKKEWINAVPEIAMEIAELGSIVTYPKVFLEPGEKFECAGLVADNYFVFPNGRVYRCPLCEDFPMHSLEIKDNLLKKTGRINEQNLFSLSIPEGCVMNKLIQPGNLKYKKGHQPEYKIACCLLKEEVRF